MDDVPGFSIPNQTRKLVDSGQSNKRPPKLNKKGGGFQVMGLSYPMLKAVMKRGYNIPTPIQRKTIPLIMEGRDVVAMAKTGSGKTACFLIPMFEKLKERIGKKGARALILSPTRELAIQTFRFIKELGRFSDLKSVLILGGDSMDTQFTAIHDSPDIIVATPGRFLHLCIEMDLKLFSIEYIVFDEADRLFEMGFGEQLNETLNRLPTSRQMVMFSATLPKLLVEFAKAGLSDPVLIRLDVESKLPEALTLKFIYCRPEERYSALLVLLKTVIPNDAQTVVFAGTQHHVELISLLLNKAKISNTYVYSNLDPSARKINTAKFAQHKVSVLIVTDIAARGIDIPNLDYVVNLHFPGKPKLFVHRVGRCARAQRSGTAFSIFSTDDQAHLLDLHLFLNRTFNMADTTAIGTIPIDFMEDEHNAVLSWTQEHDIASVYKTCRNAYKNYIQTRPNASAESNKRIKTMKFGKLQPLEEFSLERPTEQKIRPKELDKKENFSGLIKNDLLSRMQNYRPTGTVFELNPQRQALLFDIMKAKRDVHQEIINNFKKKALEMENEVLVKTKESDDDDNDEQMIGPTEDDINLAFNKVIGGKKRGNFDDIYKIKKKKTKHSKTDFMDEEYYVPYHSADKHTEDGLAINNFERAARNAEFSVTADNKDGTEVAKKLQKWDRIKKKMVSLQDPKHGKIRTESGLWIPASYKTNRYADWKQKTKIDEQAEKDNDDDDEIIDKPKGLKNHNTPAHWARHNEKVELKKRFGVDKELKKPAQIVKKRMRLEHIKQKQADNHVKRNKNRKRTQLNEKRKKK